MLDEEKNPSIRTELLRLTPSGDLLDLARQMRDMGVESLLFCGPSGLIQQVVTDRQIAHLAVTADPAPMAATASPDPSAEVVPQLGSTAADPAIPRQGTPSRADSGASVFRT